MDGYMADADIRTFTTDFCTSFAMLVLVFCAFIGTLITDFCAKLQQFMSMFRIPRKKGCCQQTNVGAFAIKFDATCKHADIQFIKSFTQTLIAFIGTII